MKTARTLSTLTMKPTGREKPPDNTPTPAKTHLPTQSRTTSPARISIPNKEILSKNHLISTIDLHMSQEPHCRTLKDTTREKPPNKSSPNQMINLSVVFLPSSVLFHPSTIKFDHRYAFVFICLQLFCIGHY
jgi:hypothetical protein